MVVADSDEKFHHSILAVPMTHVNWGWARYSLYRS